VGSERPSDSCLDTRGVGRALWLAIESEGGEVVVVAGGGGLNAPRLAFGGEGGVVVVADGGWGVE
jgi:hypothetical protein